MRQARARLSDFVNVEEHGTRDVAAVVILARRRGNSRQFEGRVDDPDMRVVEMRGEPLGVDQGFGMRVGHGSSPASLRESKDHAAVLFSLILDLAYRNRADLTGAADMRAAAGLQIDT